MKKLKKVLAFYFFCGIILLACDKEARNKSLKYTAHAPLAQLVEHLTLNQVVQGSRPWQRTPSTVFVGISYEDGTFFLSFFLHIY